MNKKFLISMFLILAVCTAGCNFGANTKINNHKQSKQVNKVTKSKNSVPQTYEEWVAQNGNQPKAAHRNLTSTRTANTPRVAFNTPQQNTTQPKKELMGDVIPDWVYNNTAPTDDYYDALHYYSNFIYYPENKERYCPIEAKIKKDISNAISKAGVYGKFQLKPMSAPKSMKCHKVMERFSESQVMSIVDSRQKDVPESERQWMQTEDGKEYCIPYGKNGHIPDGACKCSVEYFIENCNNGGNICIINPKARRIISMQPNEEELVKKLNELKNNW